MTRRTAAKWIGHRQLLLLAGLAILVIALSILWPAEDAEPPATQTANTGDIAVRATSPRPVPQNPPQPARAQRPDGLTLTGISVGSHGSGAILIADSDGRQRRIKVGGTVSKGWILAEVAPFHAILSSGDGQQARLDWRSTGLENTIRPDPPSAAEADADAGFNGLILSLQKDAGGYRLTSVPPVLKGLGLQAGDVLTGFDGDAFDNPERIQDLARRITLNMGGRVTYERGGNTREAIIPRG